jgi:hypothetical protein
MFDEYFNPDYPERFNFELLDSRKLADAAKYIQGRIFEDLCTTGRHLIPGLRAALVVIYSTDSCERG